MGCGYEGYDIRILGIAGELCSLQLPADATLQVERGIDNDNPWLEAEKTPWLSIQIFPKHGVFSARGNLVFLKERSCQGGDHSKIVPLRKGQTQALAGRQELKSAIEDVLGIPIHQQRLIHGSQELQTGGYPSGHKMGSTCESSAVLIATMCFQSFACSVFEVR